MHTSLHTLWAQEAEAARLKQVQATKNKRVSTVAILQDAKKLNNRITAVRLADREVAPPLP